LEGPKVNFSKRRRGSFLEAKSKIHEFRPPLLLPGSLQGRISPASALPAPKPWREVVRNPPARSPVPHHRAQKRVGGDVHLQESDLSASCCFSQRKLQRKLVGRVARGARSSTASNSSNASPRSVRPPPAARRPFRLLALRCLTAAMHCSPGTIVSGALLLRACAHTTAMRPVQPRQPILEAKRCMVLARAPRPPPSGVSIHTISPRVGMHLCDSRSLAKTARPRPPAAAAPTVLHAPLCSSRARLHAQVQAAAQESTTFESQTNKAVSEIWTRVGNARDWQGFFPFFKANAPTQTVVTEWGTFDNVVVPFGNFSAERCFARGRTTIVVSYMYMYVCLLLG